MTEFLGTCFELSPRLKSYAMSQTQGFLKLPCVTSLSRPSAQSEICRNRPAAWRASIGPRRPRTPRARTRENSPNEEQEDPWTTEKLGFTLVGVIVAPHGVRGEVKVRATTDFGRQRLGTGAVNARRYLLLPGRKYPRPVKVLSGRKASQLDTWILRLDCIHTREYVGEIRGAGIYVKNEDRPRMSGDEFTVGEVTGMNVQLVGQPGHFIGIVRSVITRAEICRASGAGAASEAVAADILEIALCGEDGQPADNDSEASLVPFVKQLVPHVDRKNRVVIIDPPEGLLDITKVNNKYKPPPPRGLLMAARDLEMSV